MVFNYYYLFIINYILISIFLIETKNKKIVHNTSTLTFIYYKSKMREKKVLIQLWLNSISKVRQAECIGCQTKQNSQKYHNCLEDCFGTDYFGMPYDYYQTLGLEYMLEKK